MGKIQNQFDLFLLRRHEPNFSCVWEPAMKEEEHVKLFVNIFLLHCWNRHRLPSLSLFLSLPDVMTPIKTEKITALEKRDEHERKKKNRTPLFFLLFSPHVSVTKWGRGKPTTERGNMAGRERNVIEFALGILPSFYSIPRLLHLCVCGFLKGEHA